MRREDIALLGDATQLRRIALELHDELSLARWREADMDTAMRVHGRVAEQGEWIDLDDVCRVLDALLALNKETPDVEA